MAKEILCTLGPASMNKQVIRRLEQLGVSLFRINLSHTAENDVANAIDTIAAYTSVPICLDTEGAQIRTGNFTQSSFDVSENAMIRAHKRRVPGDARDINFNPIEIIDDFKLGDFISIDFNSVLVQITGLTDEHADMRVLNGGTIGRNKAVTVHRSIQMPCLSDKDRAAIRIGRERGVSHFALSFANTGDDVREIRELSGDDSFIISKIECINGLTHLKDILDLSDAVLIDRGDLSRELPIERIPRAQKKIIRQAHGADRKVYVATNLLESMVNAQQPTRAEVNDIYNTLMDGADGLVLAAETAIGKYPIECANMIVRMVHEYESREADSGDFYPETVTSLLTEPNGGMLVNRMIDPDAPIDFEALPEIHLPVTDLMDVEQLAVGTYSPLDGFMGSETLEAVLTSNRTPAGVCWTLPVILQIGEDQRNFSIGDQVALKASDGLIIGLLDVSEIYEFDMQRTLQLWFGTTDDRHPGVKRVISQGNKAVAGKVTLVNRLPEAYAQYALTPSQTRFIFSHKGWSRVVGFHGRNPAHRAHEYIQLEALERSSADGLLISPVIGPKKSGDFLPEPIIESYQALLDFGIFPAGRTLLSGFASYSRYCGPREAVFTALCRKNMGCSHFIIGRDHTGVGNFYAPGANRALFESLDDLGIEPIFFDTIGYDAKRQEFVSSGDADAIASISGSEIRDKLRNGESLPDWFMRDIVQDVLKHNLKLGRPLFHE